MEILLKKELGGLRADNDAAIKVLSSIKSGASVVADIKDQSRRSSRQHSFFFAVVSILYESQETYSNFDHFRKGLLIHLGRCSKYPTKGGGEVVFADSVAFGKMSPSDFTQLMDETLDVAVKLGFDRASLESEAKAKVDYNA